MKGGVALAGGRVLLNGYDYLAVPGQFIHVITNYIWLFVQSERSVGDAARAVNVPHAKGQLGAESANRAFIARWRGEVRSTGRREKGDDNHRKQSKIGSRCTP